MTESSETVQKKKRTKKKNYLKTKEMKRLRHAKEQIFLKLKKKKPKAVIKQVSACQKIETPTSRKPQREKKKIHSSRNRKQLKKQVSACKKKSKLLEVKSRYN